MNFLLAVDPNKKLGFSEAFSFGGQTLLIGMVAVFAVLIIIWFSLILLKFFLHDLPAKRALEPKEAPAPSSAAPIVQASTDDEIVAVLAAAIAMAESENSELKFRVVSFRRK